MSNVFYLADHRPEPESAKRGAQDGTSSSRSAEELAALRLRSAEMLEKMARLQEAIARRRPPPPESNPLGAATPILLFHTSYGRNAWQSTWIARYERNTLTESHDAAKALVAGKLKQGSAYRLVITPGWHLQFDRRAYLVCEINSNAPFARLRAAPFVKQGVMESDAMKMLLPTSDLWRGAPPLHDSVIVQETRRPASDFAAWGSRTYHPYQTRTPGRYQRVIDGKHWWFRAINNDGPIDFDTTAFAALVDKASNSAPESPEEA